MATSFTAPKFRASVAIGIALLVTNGCNSGGRAEPPRSAVSGTVTLNGMPLVEGKINFVSPAEGSVDSLDIKDGKFAGRVEIGERRVEIQAYRVEKVDKDGMQSEAQISLIPPTYNVDSQLSAKVDASGPNSFTFDLKSS